MRIAVVGLGKMGEIHAQKLSKMPDVQPAIVFRKRISPVENRAKYAQTDAAASRIFGRQVPLFDSLDTCLAKFKPETAIIASSTIAHFGQAHLLIMAGIPLLVEKPLTLSPNDDTSLRVLAEKKEVPFVVGYNERFNGAVHALFNLNWLGKLGSIKSIESTRTFKSNKSEHPLVNLGIHDMDIILRILRDPKYIDYAFQKNSGCQVTDAWTRIVFERAEARVRVVFSEETTREMHIVGDKGTATVDFFSKTLTMTGSSGGKFRSETDAIGKELAWFLEIARDPKIAKKRRESDPWLFDLGTNAVEIMTEAAAKSQAGTGSPTSSSPATSPSPQ